MSKQKEHQVVDYVSCDDEFLLKEAREGNHAAFGFIVKRYQNNIATVVISMLGKSSEAEEIGQDVFIRFHSSINQFKGEAKLSTYLTRIAINLSLNELKKRKRMHEVIQEKDVSELGTGEQNQFESRDLVAQSLARLSEPFRAIITLRMIEGFSTKETADILDIPLGTALSRLARAQEKLKEIITKLNGDERN